MGQRQKAWARIRRDWLFEQLGRRCVICGTTENLEFDVIIPVGNDDHHRRMEWSKRMSFYTRQYETNNLQVLCSKDNSRKSNGFTLQPYLMPDQPF